MRKVLDRLRAFVCMSILVSSAGCGSALQAQPLTLSPAQSLRSFADGELLYVVDGNVVNFFQYSGPNRVKLLGTIGGLDQPAGLCASARGDIFVTDTLRDKIYEYAFGSTRLLATLTDRYGPPLACAVDRHNGDLAVVNAWDKPNRDGSLLIFAGHRGTPKEFRDKNIHLMWSCIYDDRDTLYVGGDSQAFYNPFVLAKLSRGATALVDLSLHGAKVNEVSGLQWDGKHLVVSDAYHNEKTMSALIQYRISGASATAVRVINLQHSGNVNDFVLAGSRALGTDSEPYLSVYGYPSGALLAVISSNMSHPSSLLLAQK